MLPQSRTWHLLDFLFKANLTSSLCVAVWNDFYYVWVYFCSFMFILLFLCFPPPLPYLIWSFWKFPPTTVYLLLDLGSSPPSSPTTLKHFNWYSLRSNLYLKTNSPLRLCSSILERKGQGEKHQLVATCIRPTQGSNPQTSLVQGWYSKQAIQPG